MYYIDVTPPSRDEPEVSSMGRVQFWQPSLADSRCDESTRCVSQHLGRFWILVQFGGLVLTGRVGVPTSPESILRAGKSRTLATCDKPTRDGYG